jgi:hypothetical protein
MSLILEYHKPMRHSISAAFAFFSSLAVLLFLTVSAHAQINGASASVTSPGFGGRPVNGPPSSVTSVGPRGYAPVPRPGFIPNNSVHNGHNGHDGHNGHQGDGSHDGHHHHDNAGVNGPVWYAVPIPYGADYSGYAPDQQQAEDTAEDDADYQGGPTVFDRRGQGERSYVPPAKQAAPPRAPERAEADPAPTVDPDPPLPPTLLVFKDGRTVEVGNYAIQGATLFDLTPGHRRRILIADLDLDATRKQNDERGVGFQLPQSTKVN